MTLIDDRYQVLESLGGTLSAQVFRVYDTLLEQPRVLKGVEGPSDRPDVVQLRGEYALLSRIQHPRVVRVHDLGLAQPANPDDPASHPFLYFTLDYVSGENLRSACAASLEERLYRFAELVEAVGAVHQHGLRCGDLKPENILIGGEGVQLIDFGLTREAESLDVGRLPTGTLPYMSPEVLRGQAGDLRADLFSLGVLLFELLTGQPPFPQADTVSSRLQCWQGATSSARSLLPDALRESLPEPLLIVLDRLLSVTPAGRPTDTAAVCRALEATSAELSIASGGGATLPVAMSFLAEQPLVGREQLLASIEAAYSAARREGIRRLELIGPRGIGRSRLLKAIGPALLERAGGRVLRMSADELPETARAQLQAWLDGTGVLTSEAPAWLSGLQAACVAARRGEGPLVVLLLDEVALELPDPGGDWLETPPGQATGPVSGALGGAVSGPLGGAVSGSLSGPSSGPSTGPLAGLWICRIPPGGREARGPLGSQPAVWETAGEARPGVRVLPLQGLPEDAVRLMVEQASGLVRAPETIARFSQFSEGNPGILRALLRHPTEMSHPSEALVSLLRPLAGGDLASISPEARETGRCAALLREPLSLEVLSGLLELSRERLAPLLQELTVAGILVLDRESPSAFQFRRPMVRAVLAAELDPTRRQELHRRAGRLLERRSQLGGQVSNAALAYHFDRTDDGERARRYLGRALRDAVQSGALLEAHDLCHRLLDRLPDGDPERTRIFSQLGDINLSLQRFPQAESAFAQALATLEAESDVDHLFDELRIDLLTRLARAREERGDFSGARERIEEALELGGRGEGVGSLEQGRLALALGRVSYREGRLEAARSALQRGIQVLEHHQENTDLVEAFILDGLIRMDSGDLEGAAAPLARGLELATAAGLTAGRMRALHNLHILEARRGNLPAAIDHLQSALDLAEAAGDVARLGAGYNNLGILQRRMGDARKALKSFRRAARTFERVGDRAGLVTVHYSQAELLRERGEHGRALEQLDEAETLAEAIGGGFREQALQRTRLVRGEILLALGQLDEAQPLLEQSRRDAEARGDREAVLVAELALAEVSLARGDTLEVERRCADLGQRVASGRQGIALDRILARLHHHLGHHYGAEYIERSRSRGREVLGSALLEVAQAQLPEKGAEALRASLEESIRLLDAGGRGQLAARARGVLEVLGAGSEERLELLKEVLDLLQQLGDRREVLAHLVSLAARVLRAERGLLLCLRNGGDVVDFTVLHGMNLGEAQRVSGEIVRRVAEVRGPVIVADALEDPSLIGSASIQDLQIRSVLGLPVDRDDQGMWILYLDHRQLPGVFTAESRPLLERLSQLASGLLREIKWRERLLARVEAPETNHRRYGMVGVSRAIERVREYIDNLGHLKLHNENLLFIGESGTGKELVARAVHQVLRAGRDIPYIAQSCADIPAELIESTLFGHRRGAFTGAQEDRAGIFELANNGVLFLDEIGELPLHLQASLLRVLEERTVSRIGEPEKPRVLSLIVVCATNRDLSKEVEAGRFRRDLFHRLNQVFRLPPLRERREDTLPLLRHFMGNVEDFNGQSPEDVFNADVLLWFHEHAWPGNIRELKNMVEAIPVRIKARRRQVVTLEDLGIRPYTREGAREGHGSSSGEPGEPTSTSETLRDFTERMEGGYIRRVMEQTDWDITSASSRLGLTYQGLRKRLIRYEWMDEVERRRR